MQKTAPCRCVAAPVHTGDYQCQLGLSLCADNAPLTLSACASPCRSQEATEQAEAELLRTGALQGAAPLETICEERSPSRDTVQSSSLQELPA